ncbi:MAG: lipid-binding SYLF domain-containing protein [Paracoccaceae bacterium]|nr:lipid-binding SYLF domain-containing protein [Paracoccaceae bacterium]
MNKIKRRDFFAGALITIPLMNCSNNTITKLGSDIDREAANAMALLYEINPDTQSIFERAAGVLIMPSITKASFGIGGAYGEGVLQIKGAPIDYYSVASASYGIQLGALKYSHVLFFMTQESLRDFRTVDGWEIGADAEVTFKEKGYSYGISSNTVTKPIYGIIFGQVGVMAGASLEGAKYSRLIRG